MKICKFLSTFLFFVVLFFPYLCFSIPITIKFATTVPTPHPSFQAEKIWCERVERETSGKVKFVLYPANTICSPLEVFNAVKSGMVQMGAAPTGYAWQYLPFNKFVGDAIRGTTKAVDNLKIYRRLIDSIPALKEEFRDVKLLRVYTTVTLSLGSKRQVLNLEDFKGLSLRMPPGLEPIAKAWGANPVSMPMSEIYLALEKGTVEGYVGGAEMLKSMRLAEVIKYVTFIKMFCATSWVGINKDFWNSLPADVKEVMERLSLWGGELVSEAQDKGEADAIEFSKEKGVKFIEPDLQELKKIWAAADSFFEKLASDLETKGYPAKKALLLLKGMP